MAKSKVKTMRSRKISLPGTVRPEHITEARYVAPGRLFLQFADGLAGTWTFAELALNMSNMNLATIKSSSTGTSVEVKSKQGDVVDLDVSSLRYLIDPDYAATIDNRINKIAKKMGL